MAVNQSVPSRPERASDNRLFLRDEELAEGVHLVLAAAGTLDTLLAAPLAAEGLSRSQGDVLMAIGQAPGIDVASLRRQLSMTVPTLARLLGQLDTRGLIDRTHSSSKDARRRALHLTPAGTAAAERLSTPLRQRLKAAYRAAGPHEVAGLKTVLEALIATAEPRDG